MLPAQFDLDPRGDAGVAQGVKTKSDFNSRQADSARLPLPTSPRLPLLATSDKLATSAKAEKTETSFLSVSSCSKICVCVLCGLLCER